MRLTNTQRASIFGKPGKVHPVIVTTPWGVRTQCHPAIAPLFLEACAEAAATSSWKPRRIDGYNPRRIEGTTTWSIHSWALAWDFFATPPGVSPPGGVWTPRDGMPAEFAACFERRGFTWGAKFTRKKDTPHIEWAAALPKAAPTISPQEDDDLTPAEKKMLEEVHAVAKWLKDTLDKNADQRMEHTIGSVNVHTDMVVAHHASK